MTRDDTLRAIIDRVLALDLAHPARVGVSGVTASGKSTLASELAAEAARTGRPVIRASIDDFHNPRAIRYRQGRDSAIGYYEDAHDYAALRDRLLAPLGPGGTLVYRPKSLDLPTDVAVTGGETNAAPDTLLIVDGTFLFKDRLVDAFDYRVFVDTSFPIALRRGVARDSGGREDEAMEALYRSRYHAASKLYLEQVNPRDLADAIVHNDVLAHPGLTFRDR